jgi:SAM-dependent methyltransferase
MQVNKDFYNSIARKYSDNVKSLHNKRESEKFLALIPQVSRILDLGCGSGRDAAIFSRLGHDVIGIDFSDRLIEIAKRRRCSARFFVMDMKELDFISVFDGIWANASLMFLPKKEVPGVISECKRLLAPKGILYLSVKKGKGEGLAKDSRYDDRTHYISLYSKKELETIIKKAGFRILESYLEKKKNAYDDVTWINVFCQNQ